MKSSIFSHATHASVIACLVFLNGCTGDVRDLSEPVEASRLDLATLTIVPPEGALEPLVINPGEQVSFALTGTNSLGQSLAIPSTNRRWAVSDSSVATINEDGLLTGAQNGTVQVSAMLGEERTPEFTVEVEFGVLSGVSVVADTTELQPCLAQTFTAAGTYTDPSNIAVSSQRSLFDVDWTIDPADSATLVAGDTPGSITVAANTSGSLTLTASADGFFGQATLTVDSSLESLSIPDAIRIPANESLQLVGFGNYTTDDANQAIDITDGLNWTILTGEESASVGNTSSNKALLSGITNGPAQVQAACGDISAVTQVDVVDPITILSAEDDDTDIGLLVGGVARQLNISTGSSYDEDDDVTNLATWGVQGPTGVASVSNTGDTRGIVTAVGVGTVRVIATFDSASIEFTVTVR